MVKPVHCRNFLNLSYYLNRSAVGRVFVNSEVDSRLVIIDLSLSMGVELKIIIALYFMIKGQDNESFMLEK